MKSRIKSVGAVVALTGMMVLAMATGAKADDAPYCSNATLKGQYADTETGTATVSGVPVPFAALEITTADGKGNISGTRTLVVDGTVSTETVSATYSISSDCSGTFSYASGVTKSIAVQQDGSLVQIIVTTPAASLSPATITGLARNLASRSNPIATLHAEAR